MSTFVPRNSGYEAKVRAIFGRAAFMTDLGVELVRLAPGLCETALGVQPRFLQQDGVVHAGVVTSLADHSAGAAAGSLVGADETVLTVELSVRLLRAATGERLECRAQVLRAGRTLVFAESEVLAEGRLAAKAAVTLAVVKSAGY